MSSPLDRFRRPQLVGSQPKEEEAGEASLLPEDESTYTAYRPGNRVRRLMIRPCKDAHRAPSYQQLIDVMWDAQEGREIGLVFAHACFNLRGRNLQDLAQLLASEQVVFVQEFDPKRWEKPAPEEPIIELIEVRSRVAPGMSEERKKSDPTNSS